MKRRMALLAAAFVVGSLATAPTATWAETLRWAFQGDLKSLDPYTLNETFTLGALGNVYEGLTKRDKDLAIVPGLAESWELIDATTWRFHLRHDVKYHNGNAFTADDVLFSADRVRAKGSDLTTRLPADLQVVKVDDYTVDFKTAAPNPILFYEWDTWYIIDKEWAEANNAVAPTTAAAANEGFAAFNANGTGPFKIASHEPGVKTVFQKNADWWDTPTHNLDEVVFTPISQDATRVAALLSGEVDLMDPVPVQDIERVNSDPNTEVLVGPELRTIFLGFDQKRDVLKGSNVTDKNPFKDVRVRKAFYQAIDIETIKTKIMRGLSAPSALLISPFLYARSGEFQRFPYDPAAAKALLAEAGYPNGFSVTMDCPNDRYVNDEAICQAAVQMLAKIGVTVNLNAQPKAQYFAKVLAAGGYDTSFYLLGWTPGSFDSYNVLLNIVGCRDDSGKGGPFNLGGYCNPKVDELAAQILVETDPAKRDDLIYRAYMITNEDVSHIPLHQQALAWGVRKNVHLQQRADNQVMLYRITKD